MKNIILIGYRCTGKTSVGEKLSERLDLPFTDTDDLVTREAGMSVGEIVREGGWALFRRKEKGVIARLSTIEGTIIAPGGGAFEDPENREAMRGKGLFVWLTADVKTIMERILADRKSSDQRPPLSDGNLEAQTALIMEEREPIYRGLAALTIDTSQKGIDSVVDTICELLQKE
ncbi:MAG: shikimate kinase [Deltaproteobacteria bacterium]|nr:shikimate kinase [Deltaproteobacteria bacterium]